MQQKIIILDFGSQTTQLIGRRVRELDTFCEILPYNKFPKDDTGVIGVILSGSPYSVHDKEAFKVDLSQFIGKYPVLGICYGAQFISYSGGGKVEQTGTREYGRANLQQFDASNPLFKDFKPNSQVWMSHGDTITAIPSDYHVIGSTADVKYAAFASDTHPVWCVQFHPEVYHSTQGTQLLRNFVVDICGSRQEWSPASFVDSTVKELKEQLGNSAQVQEVTDVNGFKAIKVTFASAILFPFNGTTLNQTSKQELSEFASSLINNPDTDVTIEGFTDNVGSLEANTKVANGRADAVKNYLMNSGVASSRLTAKGLPMQDYVASNDTDAGRAQNRRVEIYITANEQMVKQAEAQAQQNS